LYIDLFIDSYTIVSYTYTFQSHLLALGGLVKFGLDLHEEETSKKIRKRRKQSREFNSRNDMWVEERKDLTLNHTADTSLVVQEPIMVCDAYLDRVRGYRAIKLWIAIPAHLSTKLED